MKIFLAKFISFFCKNYFLLRYRGRVFFGKDILINHRFSFSGKGSLTISDNCNLWAHDELNRFQTYDKNAEIFIGKNTRLNGVLIQCREKIVIGNNCLLGSAILMDHDFHIWPEKSPLAPLCKKEHLVPSAPIIIKDKVWLAGQSVVLKGVTIEKNNIVGFRAVVVKDCGEGGLIVGNPGIWRER